MRAEHADIASKTYDSIELDGKKIFMTHYSDEVVDGMALSGKYDLVLYGHNHLREEKRVGDTLVVNPGAVYGNKQSPSYAIYDTVTDTVEFIELTS